MDFTERAIGIQWSEMRGTQIDILYWNDNCVENMGWGENDKFTAFSVVFGVYSHINFKTGPPCDQVTRTKKMRGDWRGDTYTEQWRVPTSQGVEKNLKL